MAAMHGAWRQAVPDPKWVNTRLLEISLTQQCGIHESERRKERTREVKFHISVFTRKCVVILKEPQVHFPFLSCKTLVTKGQLFQRFLPPCSKTLSNYMTHNSRYITADGHSPYIVSSMKWMMVIIDQGMGSIWQVHLMMNVREDSRWTEEWDAVTRFSPFITAWVPTTTSF